MRPDCYSYDGGWRTDFPMKIDSNPNKNYDCFILNHQRFFLIIYLVINVCMYTYYNQSFISYLLNTHTPYIILKSYIKSLILLVFFSSFPPQKKATTGRNLRGLQRRRSPWSWSRRDDAWRDPPLSFWGSPNSAGWMVYCGKVHLLKWMINWGQPLWIGNLHINL